MTASGDRKSTDSNFGAFLSSAFWRPLLHFSFQISAFSIFRVPFLFPIIQRRHGDFRVSRVSDETLFLVSQIPPEDPISPTLPVKKPSNRNKTLLPGTNPSVVPLTVRG
jgi:hypothetical protein